MKNKTKKRLGVVAAMLGLVVAIGAVAGNTLAKYISSVKVESEVATVAQWGYTVTANASDLFSKTYAGNKIAASNADSLDVKATAKVVAPGTSSANDAEGAEGALVVTINGNGSSCLVRPNASDKCFPTEDPRFPGGHTLAPGSLQTVC